MATIAFLAQQLDLRGTSVSTYAYAQGCEEQLGHRAAVLYLARAANDPPAIVRFRRRFTVVACEDLDAADHAAEWLHADLVYVQKGEGRDKWTAKAAPTAVHQVFPAWAHDAHAERYAYISRWLARACAGASAPRIPYIVTLPDRSGDLRAELQIPDDALVVGCHGRALCFDIDFAKHALARALEVRRDLYFVGLNLAPFLTHERALFLPGAADPAVKRRFLDTCDAMLHARKRGETFGLAVAEFSLANRPVLTWDGANERAHLDMLGDSALVYRNERGLFALLTSLDRRELARRDWDRYSRDYAPAPVMARFDDVFLRNPPDPARLRSAWVGPEDYSPGGLSRYLRRIRRRLRGKSP